MIQKNIRVNLVQVMAYGLQKISVHDRLVLTTIGNNIHVPGGEKKIQVYNVRNAEGGVEPTQVALRRGGRACSQECALILL